MKKSSIKINPFSKSADKEIPVKIKDRLYPVVLDLFAHNDFHQVNLRDISTKSGMSTSTIYRYFPSKEALLFAILDEKLSEIRRLVSIHIQGIESTKEIIRKIFWVTMDFYDRNPEVAIISFVTVPMSTWIREPGFIRGEETRVLVDIMKGAKRRNDINTKVALQFINDVYYMVCYRYIYTWYYHGMKWKLVDTIPQFFDHVWKMLEPEK